MRLLKLKAILLLSLIVLTGCSSDDDGGPTGPQVSSDLYGEWTIDLIISNGETNGNISCDDKINYKFNSNETYIKNTFATDESDNCIESLNISGSWEIITEQSIMLTPNSSELNSETIDFELISDNEKLQINRSENLTEIYVRP